MLSTTTIQKIKNLHEDTLDYGYDRPTWKANLAEIMTGEELSLIHDDVMEGSILLRDETIVSLAKTEYPWMFNQMTYTVKDNNGKESERKAPAWIDKIRDRGITRPKDILHLSKLCMLAENAEALSDMEW